MSLQSGATNQPAILYLGASNSQWGSRSLPLPLPGGGPSCFLYASGETTLATSTDGNGQASFQIPVPGVYTLVTASFYHSWLVLDPSAPNNPFGFTGSDGVETVIGK